VPNHGGLGARNHLPHPAGRASEKDSVFVFALAVPALLVVLIGYAVGYGLWSAVAGTGGAETAGWVTGTALLVAVVTGAVRWRRRRSHRRRDQGA
jgi:hypothetical protein